MAFVVTEGQVRALTRPAVVPATAIRLADDFTQDYAAIWRTQGAVRTAVSFLARNVAGLGLHVYERVSDTDRDRVTDHPFARLLSRPNGRTTTYRLMSGVMHDLGIFDVAYLVKVRTGDGFGLFRLPPLNVTPFGTGMFPDGFKVSGRNGTKELGYDQVVHFRGYAPDGDRAGSPPIESLRQVLAEEWEAGRYRAQTFRNGARMSGYLTRPAGAPVWSETARKRFAKAWRSQYAGNGPEAGGTPVLEDGMTFNAAAQTATDLQYVEARKLTREEVAAAYFIPPTMVGIMEGATFSNVREQHKHLYQDTLGPWLAMITQELALQLLDDFDDDHAGRLYVEFNLAAKLAGSFEEQAAQLSTSVGAPWLTRNEARGRQNLPAIDGGDELVVPLNVLTGGQASPRDSAPPDPVPGGLAGGASLVKAGRPGGFKVAATVDDREAAEVLFRDFFTRQERAVLSALGAGGSWWDGDRWDEELAADLRAFELRLVGRLGPAAAAGLGFNPDAFDLDRTAAFLTAVARSRAEMVNAATRDQVAETVRAADPDRPPAAVFEVARKQRALAAGAAIVTTAAAFATVEAGRQLAPDRVVKTWRTTSANPRDGHARMDGETVPIDALFSNGLNWPGDPANGPDDVAGCQCTVDVSIVEGGNS